MPLESLKTLALQNIDSKHISLTLLLSNKYTLPCEQPQGISNSGNNFECEKRLPENPGIWREIWSRSIKTLPKENLVSQGLICIALTLHMF